MSTTDDIRKMLGQCFFIGFDGIEIPPSIAKFIKENSIGGVTLFANNYQSPAQVAELSNQLQAIRNHDLPMVIAVDHEGGKVQRFKKPFTKFPEARMIGDFDSPKLAFECAAIMAKELKTVGMNMVFAPVADINTNPSNPVIGRRAFGETEERVSKMVSAYIRGFITHGVQPVVKHFPGHGDTAQDSHFHLPKVKTTEDILLQRETRPFLKAFKARCQVVMTAHIIVESLDPKTPATLSKKVLQDLLRGQLRYKGLIISDDMEMKAMTDNFGEVEAPLRALEAGVDVLLYHTENFINKVFEPLLSKLTSPEGKPALDMLKAAHQRIELFKREHFLPYKPVYIPEIATVVGAKDHLELAEKIENGTLELDSLASTA